MTLDIVGECASSGSGESTHDFFRVVVSIFVVYIGLDVAIGLLTIYIKLKEAYPAAVPCHASSTQLAPNSGLRVLQIRLP